MSRRAVCQAGVAGITLMMWALAAADLPGPLPLVTAAASASLVALTLWGHSRAGTALAVLLLMLAARQAVHGHVAAALVVSVLMFVLLLLAGQLATDTYAVTLAPVLAVCAASAVAVVGTHVSGVALHGSVMWWPVALAAMLVAYAIALPRVRHAARPNDDRTEA